MLCGTDFCVQGREATEAELDEFYKEPLNVRIPAQYAMEYVRDEIVGKKYGKTIARCHRGQKVFFQCSPGIHGSWSNHCRHAGWGKQGVSGVK